MLDHEDRVFFKIANILKKYKNQQQKNVYNYKLIAYMAQQRNIYNKKPNVYRKRKIYPNMLHQSNLRPDANLEQQRNARLERWSKFLEDKKVNDPRKRKDIINFYLDYQNKDILDCPSLKDAWLGKGAFGVTLNINGKAIKYEDYREYNNEEEFLSRFKKIKNDNEKQTKEYLGKQHKPISRINASKHINAPEKVEIKGNKMISAYEIAKCDLKKLAFKQQDLKKYMSNEDWIRLQKIILGNLLTQMLKALSIVHMNNEAHGDVNIGNILVSTRWSEKNKKYKIKFLLHDRNYGSGLIWLSRIAKGETYANNTYLLTGKREMVGLKEPQIVGTKVVPERWMYYLQVFDMDMLHNDVQYYLSEIALDERTKNTLFFQRLYGAINTLKKYQNATKALKSGPVEDLRHWMNLLNQNYDKNINEIL